MKKRIVSILLTLCMVLMLVPATAFAANDDATELQSLLNGGGTVTLSKDYTIDTTLYVTNTVTLDLNGHVISMTGSGSVIQVESGGNLTLQDSSNPSTGVITGGNAENGGGVEIDGGSFTLKSGTIENCSAVGGGGVAFLNNGSFQMDGGTIENCSAVSGGGVAVLNNGSFQMDGGTIANCIATGTPHQVVVV